MGHDVDCAPDSAGNRRNPVGQDIACGAVAGSVEIRWRETFEREEYCVNEAVYFLQ